MTFHLVALGIGVALVVWGLLVWSHFVVTVRRPWPRQLFAAVAFTAVAYSLGFTFLRI